HAKGLKEEKKDQGKNCSTLVYSVTEIPPWYLCILLGIQHYLTALGGLVAIPLILSKELCLQHDPLTQGHLISTIFFVSGICTLLQVLFGVRKKQGIRDPTWNKKGEIMKAQVSRIRLP
ncbi:Solute carrier family 23 member 2, partial [Chelonia mydas]